MRRLPAQPYSPCKDMSPKALAGETFKITTQRCKRVCNAQAAKSLRRDRVCDAQAAKSLRVGRICDAKTLRRNSGWNARSLRRNSGWNARTLRRNNGWNADPASQQRLERRPFKQRLKVNKKVLKLVRTSDHF